MQIEGGKVLQPHAMLTEPRVPPQRGPSFRVGRATQSDDGSHETGFTTVVVGLRVTVAVP